MSAKLHVCFVKSDKRDSDPVVTVAGRRLSVAHEFKYLGILIDSQLTFKTQVLKDVATK